MLVCLPNSSAVQVGGSPSRQYVKLPWEAIGEASVYYSPGAHFQVQ